MCCFLPSQHYYQNKLKLAIIGQSLFGQEVYSSLRKQGHRVVGVFTVPDKDGKADPLGKSPVSSLGFFLIFPTLLDNIFLIGYYFLIAVCLGLGQRLQ